MNSVTESLPIIGPTSHDSETSEIAAITISPFRPTILTAGFPCQPFSGAGKQLGEQDERHIWPDILRVIQEIKPRVVFLENVKELRTIADGNAFRGILRSLAESGYICEWNVIPALAVGAPHWRYRLFIVAYANSIGIELSAGHERERVSNPAVGSETSVGVAHTDAFGRESEWSECEVWQRGSATLSSGNPVDMGNSTGPRRQIGNTQGEGADSTLPAGKRGGTVGVPDGERRQEQCGDFAAKSPISGAERTGRWDAQSPMGTYFDGLTERLARHRIETRWPAFRNQAQYEWEPPRLAKGIVNSTAKRKAVGNSICAPLVQAIAEGIWQRLAAEDAANVVINLGAE
jgi:DNA (cytosine-5)-methyltransferase 1